jgi:aspartate 1-decarboxylase
MLIKVLKSKIHRTTVTDALIDYPGSIGIDSVLMEASGIVPYESVMVADITNGARLETYVVPEPAGSGKITILGAAAKLMKKNDKVIVMGFAYLEPADARHTRPKVVIVDENNKIKEIL